MKIYVTDERFSKKTDSETIQSAIDYAAENSIKEVVIPNLNPRTGKARWDIGETILLPNDLTVILDNAHLRLENGVRSNIFRNKNAWTPLGNTLDGEQYGIKIKGIGKAVIDGGFPNGLCEQLHRDRPDLYPNMNVNLLLFLHNVRDFEVSGIKFIESRWWATCFMFCRNGLISDLEFRMYANLENQDGIDLRIGCEFITIKNITGITGDDTVALTALPNESTFERLLFVEGKSPDIHDILIDNVESASHGCGIVRLLNEDGAKEYNITVSNVRDTGEAISGCGVIIGTTDTYLMTKPHKMGEFKNIVIKEFSAASQRTLLVCEPCEDMLIENVTSLEGSEVGIMFAPNFEAKNVTVRNFVFKGSDKADSLIALKGKGKPKLDGLTLENFKVSGVKYVCRAVKPTINGLELTDTPKLGEFTEEQPSLCSAYGRYHRYAYGNLIENRPPDSRYANEKYDI